MSDQTIDDDTLRAMLEGLRCGSVHITADRCTGDSRAVEAFCDLVRVAPALAEEVLRLRGMLRAASGALAATRADLHALRAAARAYRDATDVPDGDYDATRHAEALAALNRVLGGGQ